MKSRQCPPGATVRVGLPKASKTVCPRSIVPSAEAFAGAGAIAAPDSCDRTSGNVPTRTPWDHQALPCVSYEALTQWRLIELPPCTHVSAGRYIHPEPSTMRVG